MMEIPLAQISSLPMFTATFTNIRFFIAVGVLSIRELVWKAIALYRAARRGQKGWFVFLIILNTCGILPIIYLLLTNKKNKKEVYKNEKM